MKIWNKIKNPLIYCLLSTALITLNLYLHYLGTEFPERIHGAILWPFIVIGFISDGSTIFLDSILAFGMYLTLIIIPCIAPWSKLRRFLLRPLIVISVFGLLAQPSRTVLTQMDEAAFHLTKAGHYQQIHEKLYSSDVVFVTEGGGHCTQVLSQYLPELTFAGKKHYDNGLQVYYAKSAVMLEYDDPSISFCFLNQGTYNMLTLPLENQTPSSESYDFVKEFHYNHPDTGKACKIVYYCAGNKKSANYAIVAVGITLPDGTLWSSTDIIDPKTGTPYDIGPIGSSFKITTAFSNS